MSTVTRRMLRQLERQSRGKVTHFTLEDGGVYYYRPEEAGGELFVHWSAVRRALFLGEPLPEPPPILLAIVQARDRRAVAAQLIGAFCPYDVHRIVDEGALVPSQRPSQGRQDPF
jgi:hypothetical protein